MFDCPGQHMAFGDNWFMENVMKTHLLDDLEDETVVGRGGGDERERGGVATA
jgi:hypothetical protein|tara:strand:+ start:3523 stop:3678 length:156 start_codon:yes stop_codon:yes gene_type:complete